VDLELRAGDARPSTADPTSTSTFRRRFGGNYHHHIHISNMLGAMPKPAPRAQAPPASDTPAVPSPDGAPVPAPEIPPPPTEQSFLDKIMEQNPYFSAGAGLMVSPASRVVVVRYRRRCPF
jgi:hypothetical protein